MPSLILVCRSEQVILNTGSFDRDELEEIESEMGQKTRLWRGIQTFEERLESWEKTSFEALDVEEMETEVVRCKAADQLHLLHASSGQSLEAVIVILLKGCVCCYSRRESVRPHSLILLWQFLFTTPRTQTEHLQGLVQHFHLHALISGQDSARTEQAPDSMYFEPSMLSNVSRLHYVAQVLAHSAIIRKAAPHEPCSWTAKEHGRRGQTHCPSGC